MKDSECGSVLFGTSWFSMILQFKVNQEKHWVKSGSGKHVGCMNETVGQIY